MKTCTKCGAHNSEGLIFCGTCGVNLTYQQSTMSFSQSLAANPAVKLLRQAGSSNLFLCAVILYTVVVLMLLITVFIPSQTLNFNDIWSEDYYGGYGYYDDYSDYGYYGYDDYYTDGDYTDNSSASSAAFQSLSIFGGVTSSVGPVLICIAMWLQYFAFKNNSGGRIKTTGLSIIRVIVIINFVLICVTIGLIILAMLILTSISASIGDELWNFWVDMGIYIPEFDVSAVLYIILALVLVGAAVSAVFIIIYYVKLISMIKSIISVAETGNHESIISNISMFVIVCNFLLAVFSLIGMVINTALLENQSLLLLSGAANSAFYAVISIALISYKNKLKELAVRLKAEREYSDYYGILPQYNYNAQNIPAAANEPNTVNDFNKSNESNESNEADRTTQKQQAPFVPPEE